MKILISYLLYAICEKVEDKKNRCNLNTTEYFFMKLSLSESISVQPHAGKCRIFLALRKKLLCYLLPFFFLILCHFYMRGTTAIFLYIVTILIIKKKKKIQHKKNRNNIKKSLEKSKILFPSILQRQYILYAS